MERNLLIDNFKHIHKGIDYNANLINNIIVQYICGEYDIINHRHHQKQINTYKPIYKYNYSFSLCFSTGAVCGILIPIGESLYRQMQMHHS